MTRKAIRRAVTPTDKIGDVLLIGRFSGAYCSKYEIVQRFSDTEALIVPVVEKSTRGADGFFRTSVELEETIEGRRAGEIFEALDDYGRGDLCRWGTAFTTYEDEGEGVCGYLNRAARIWATEQMCAA